MAAGKPNADAHAAEHNVALRSSRMPIGLLVVLYMNSFVAAYCNSIINVALVDIMDEFSISAALAQWTVSGYTIVTTIVVTSMAYVFLRLRARTIFFAAQACFIVSDIICIWSPNLALLIVGRLIQALGTGLSTPLMMNAVMEVVPPGRRGLMLGIASTIITLGPAFGPVVSGIFCTLFGWRMIFAPILVVSLIVTGAGAVLMRSFNTLRDASLDVPSAVLLALALFALSYGLTSVLSNPVLAAIALVFGAALLYAFARRQKTSEHPYLDIRPLRSILFWPCCLMALAALMSTFSVGILLPLYLEQGLSMSALDAGVLMLISVLFNTVTGLLAGLIVDRFGVRILLPAGFACIVAGQVIIYAVAPQYLLFGIVAGASFVCAGVGFTSSPSQVTGLSSLEPRLYAHGVSIVSAFIMLSGCLAPSLYVGVMNAVQNGATAAGADLQAAVSAGLQSGILVALVVSGAALVLSLIYTRVIQRRAK